MTTDYIHRFLGNIKVAVEAAENELSKAKEPIVRKALEDSIAATIDSHRILAEHITKAQLAGLLKLGHPISEIFPLTSGQSCSVYKARNFNVSIGIENNDLIIYIPDLSGYDLSVDKVYTNDEDIADVVSHCFSRADFFNECAGTSAKPSDLFDYVNWQSPSSALPELKED